MYMECSTSGWLKYLRSWSVSQYTEQKKQQNNQGTCVDICDMQAMTHKSKH